MNTRYLLEQGWPCPTGEEMRRIDRDAIERRGLPGRLLMENAGRAIAEAVRRSFPHVRRPLVVCGGGNNGGDGFVVARVLRDWDDRIRPTVLALGEPPPPSRGQSDEARANFELLVMSGVEVVLGREQKEVEPLLSRADLVIDAIFGVGLARPVEGPVADLLRALGASPLPLLAVDLPSGISSDSGVWLGPELDAQVIVTLGLPKLGLAVRPFAGEVWVADIGLPSASLASAGVRQHVLTRQAAARRLPARPAAAHKGTFGHVLVVAGSEGKTGAAVLAAEGALRSGAGLVTVAAPQSLHSVFEIKLTEAMSLPFDDEGSGGLVESAVEALVREAQARDAAVLGPGVGTRDAAARSVEAFLREVTRPIIVDADGLNAFAGRPEALAAAGPRVLTPHPGEMGRLLSRSTDAVQADRVSAARELSGRAQAVVVLKGARTVVAAPEGEVYVNPTGGPALASGGTGDVLAGVIGAFLAQGLGPLEAAAVGAYVHGRAGERRGPVALAAEVAADVRGVLAELGEARGEPGDAGVLLRFP